jgi:hypothetical protein
MRHTICMLVLLIGCATQEEKPVDKSGSCSHARFTAYYAASNCTGSISNTQLKSYCTEASDYENCKTYTSCSNGFYYSDAQVGIQGKSCAANGYPLACSGGLNKVSDLTNCP